MSRDPFYNAFAHASDLATQRENMGTIKRQPPLSEAAGGKVTVPMTENGEPKKDERPRGEVWLPAVPPGTRAAVIEAMLKNAQAENARLRSQVEFGMTGRYNPETHRIYDPTKYELWPKQLYGSGSSLSPSPETPDSK